MKIDKLMLIALAFGISTHYSECFAQGVPKSPTPKVRVNKPSTIETIPFVRLLANPEKYRGKKVQVIGYLVYGFEGQAIYSHKDDPKYGLTTNGIWVDSFANKTIDVDKVNGTYCIILGTFDDKNHGHMGVWSGALKDIERLDLWIDPNKLSSEVKP